MSEPKRRSVQAPGRSADVSVIFRDAAKYAVLAVVHAQEVIVLFTAPNGHTARVMSFAEAKKFTDDVRDAYQAFVDDSHISRMEKEFENGEG